VGDNRDQIAFWNGTAGERWVAAQESMDRAIGPFGLMAMDAAEIALGMRILDIGCGCGDTTIALGRRVGPTGAVTGVDISAPMIARAKERAKAEGLPLQLAVADAAVAPLPIVDRIYSRFGVMFFDDLVGAFRHMGEALAPGGRLAFVAWRTLGENPWAKLPADAAASVLGPVASPPAADAPGPFAFAKADRVRAFLTAAGWSDIEVTPRDHHLTWTGLDDDVALRMQFLRIGPAARRLADAPPELLEPAIEAILGKLRPLVVDRTLTLPGGVWVVTAAR
jgi:SAM-dependent methyltransferase